MISSEKILPVVVSVECMDKETVRIVFQNTQFDFWVDYEGGLFTSRRMVHLGDFIDHLQSNGFDESSYLNAAKAQFLKLFGESKVIFLM